MYLGFAEQFGSKRASNSKKKSEIALGDRLTYRGGRSGDGYYYPTENVFTTISLPGPFTKSLLLSDRQSDKRALGPVII